MWNGRYGLRLWRKQCDGMFGIGDERENVVINVEIAPPDYSEYNRALRLNAASSLLSEYLEYCEELDNYEGGI